MEGLTQILPGRCFVIPVNQRGYSWNSKNISELIGDLRLAGEKSHYMGPIIYTRNKSLDFTADDYTHTINCILEDGQQRITTFFILIKAIQSRLEDIASGPTVESDDLSKLIFYSRGKIPYLRLQNMNADLDACFSNCMTGSPPLPQLLTAPMKALINARDWSESWAQGMDKNTCLQWKNRLINKARLILVDLDSAGVDRYLTFDAINSRGLPLSQFDKIKNFCILLDSVCNLNTEPEKKWYSALQKLEQFKVGQRTAEEAFITELFNVFHNEKVTQGNVHSSFVEKYRPLLENRDSILEGDISSFVNAWDLYAHSFGFMATSSKHIFITSECNSTAGIWLNCLDNMDLPTITRPLLVAGHISMTQDNFEKLAQACEIYTFRIHAVSGRRKDKNATVIIKLANDILRNSKKVDYIINSLCDCLDEMAPMKTVIETLSNGTPKYHFDPSISGWAYCYYFLYEYEVWVSPNGVTGLPWGNNREQKRNTQEHILPQEHRDGGWWEKHWSEISAEKFKHRLGNLVLTDGNSVLGRKSIDKKLNDPKATYSFQCNNATNSEKLISNYTYGGSEWKEESILF